MGPEDPMRVFLLGLLVIMVGIIGVGVVIALMMAWRDHNKREHLLDEARRLRASQHPDPRRELDIWNESGRRHQHHGDNDGDDDGDDGDETIDEEAEPPDDDDDQTPPRSNDRGV